MSTLEKRLLVQDFLFVANYSDEGNLKVDVWHLQKQSNYADKDPQWLQYDSISLALNLSQPKKLTKRDPILLFENVEDSLSGIVRPTILFHFCGDAQKQSYAYILVLVKDKSSLELEKCQWKIKPIKKLKTTLDRDPKNLYFVDQCSFIHSRNEWLYFCDQEGEHSISFTRNRNVQNLICVACKTCKGTSFVLGVYTLKDDQKVSDDQDLQYRIFALKKHKFCDHHKIFEIFDPCLFFLSEDYASCITRIYIHSVEEICQNVLNAHGLLENHPSRYDSQIFLILSHGFLLEFTNGELKMIFSLVNFYRELGIFDCLGDEKSLNFDFQASIIKGVIDLEKDRKIIILQHEKVCIAVDTQNEKIQQYWQGIDDILIDDVLSKGGDQLLLVNHSPDTQKLSQWYVTDFITVYIDYLTDDPDSMIDEDDGNSSATARNALQQQLTRMSISVEEAERRLKEKVEFLQSNLSRLQKTSSTPRPSHMNLGVNEERKEIFQVEIREKWYRVISDCIVIGLNVVNISSKSISNLLVSITCNDSLNVFTSSSKQHDNEITQSTRSWATSKNNELQTLKKIKLSVPENHHSVLAPKDETVLTGYFDISQLSDSIKGKITLFLSLHFSPCKMEDSVKETQEFCVQNGGEIEMNFKELFDNSFTQSIVTIPTSDRNSGLNLHHGLLCLNTIQRCFKLVLQTKYGYINLITDWLKKIPSLVYHEHYNCYMLTLPGALYLSRMEIDLQSDFKHVHTKIYTRNQKQFELFLNLISSYLPPNISYQHTTNQNEEFIVQQFLTHVSEEINTGLEIGQLTQKSAKNDEIFKVDFKKQDNVFKFQAAFDIEKKELYQSEQTPMFLENSNVHMKKLKDCEVKTDSVVEKIGIKEI